MIYERARVLFETQFSTKNVTPLNVHVEFAMAHTFMLLSQCIYICKLFFSFALSLLFAGGVVVNSAAAAESSCFV